MQNAPKERRRLGIVVALGLVALFAGLDVQTVSAQGVKSDPKAAEAKVGPKTAAAPKAAPRTGGKYYVDFRARTAASYGHAFVWYGRVGERAVEVAGLHPATESIIPYILGHIVPVPSETGASYGDLDEDYVTASYRVILSEADARNVFAYIKQLQKTSPYWHASTHNCVAFIGYIAQYMGLQVPASTLLYPETWVKGLIELNGRNPPIKLKRS
jgi:hypothetical protein